MNIKNICLALGLILPSSLVSAEMVVIANPGVKISSIPHSQISRLFLGQSSTFPDGSQALPLDVSGDKRNVFYQEVLKKSPAQVEKYWARMIFTGKETPPRQVRGSEVRSLVAETAGAISYVDKSEVDGSVKTITVINDH